jgi:LytS/YehU family sensor histidine kinase
MAFHESFWVTVGTAAPIIALASVVSIADLMGARDRVSPNLSSSSSVQGDDWLDSELIRAGRLLIWAYLVGVVNGALQMVTLSIALQSLADGSNVVSTIVPRIIVPLGIFLLLVSTSMTVSLRTIQRQMNHHLRPGAEAR